MKEKNRPVARYGSYGLIGSAIVGPIVVLAVLLVILVLVLTPANAVGTVLLPDDIKPVAISLVSPTPVPVTPTPTLVPTITPSPITIAPTPAASLTTVLPTIPPPTPTAIPTPTPLPPLPGILPRRLRIPSVGINAYVEHVGLDNQNRMDVPRSMWNVAWYKLGVEPGQRGNAVMDGHVDGPNTAAVFWTLRDIQVGGKIFIQDDKGVEKIFEVYDIGTYPYDQAPLDRIFGSSNDAQLNLITCTGTFDHQTANYDKRFVAYARLVQNPA